MSFRQSVARTLAISAVFLVASTCRAQLMTGGWPKFRADARNTGLSTVQGPGAAAVSWTYTTGGGVSSSPAVDPNGIVYIVAQDQYLYALNPDGTMRWKYDINSTSNSSPTIGADGTIYVGSDDYYLYAINSNGTLKWRRGLGKQLKSSPAVGPDGVIYVGCMNSKLNAINPDGTVKWTYTTGNPIASSPAIGSDGTIHFGSQDAYLYALNPTGILKWRYRASSWVDGSPAIDSSGNIYVGIADGKFIAVNPTGTLKWTYTIGVGIRSSAALGSDGTVYVGADDRHIYAFNPDGTLKWRYRTEGNVQSSPAVGGDGVVYVGSFDNYIYALNPDGTLLWRHNLGGQVYSSPAIAPDGSLYIGSYDRNVYAFSKDRTPPTTPVVTDDGQYTTSPNTLHAAWSSSDPDTGILEYRYAIGTGPGATDVVDWTSTGSATQVTRTDLALVSGVTYYFSVKAQNGVHLWSSVATTDGIKADLTGPIIASVVDDGAYTSSTDTLHATWSASDVESGVVEVQYCIGTSAGSNDVVPWTSVGTAAEITKTGLTLAEGASYYVSVKSRNAAGLWSAVGTSDGIAVDRTPPAPPIVTDDGQYVASATTLHATWTASDAQSGIAEYQYAIGTTSGGTNVLGWTSAGSAAEVTKTGLSLTDGTTYYISVRARNGAGHWSDPGVSDGIMADASAPATPAVTDDGQYTISSDTLHASWSSADSHSGLAEYQYAVGTSSGGTDTINWTSTGLAVEVTRTGLALTNGTTYYISVKARNRAGSWSTVGVSDGITADHTPPSPPVVTDDGQYTPNNTAFHATWTVADAESGIAESQYAIGTVSGGTDIVGWTSAGSATEVTRSGLSLADGTAYYVSVRARNRVGQWSSPGTSNGITVDASASTTPTVVDDGDYSAPLDSLHATWGASDPHSGIGEYQYAIGASAGSADVVGWTSAGSATEVTRTGLSLTDGATYYFAAKARNGAGVWSAVGTSDGITIDHTPPAAPVVTDDGQYTVNDTSLHATWTGSDSGSGIAEYQYAIGTTPAGTDILGWTSVSGTTIEVTRTGLTLTDGVTYYFAVRARNRAKQWSTAGVTDGIVVDASVPSTPAVVDDGDYTISLDSLHAVWNANDAHSGVVEFQYAIGTSSGGTDFVGWTSIGTAAEVSRSGLPLVSGSTYYFAVKARNGAGLWSMVGNSNGIVVDHTPPAPPVVTDDGQYTLNSTTMHAVWSAVDQESGIAEYQYAMGTTSGGTNLVSWTSVGTATQVTRAGLSLADGTTCYISVRARNRAGKWSDPGVSDGITVDTTIPTLPAVTDDGQYATSPDTLHAAWSSSDPHSGIADYQYAIGTYAGATDVVGWTSAGTSGEISHSGLLLTNGRTYYFAVKAKNGVGLWSSVGVSDGVMVDSTPPSVPVVIDDGQYTTNDTALHATWSSSDSESGLAEYQYAIGTTPGDTNIIGWTSTGTTATVTKTGLSLTDGVTYYISVRARNRAAKWSEPGTSDGIMADASAPTPPAVVDDGEFTAFSNSLHATWSSSDPHSGVASYEYAIGTAAGLTNVVGWTSVGPAQEITRTGLYLTDGGTYYFAVRARNNAGLLSLTGVSDGITVDKTPPPAPVVTDEGDYTLSPDALHASWTVTGYNNAIGEYQYAIGTTPGGTNVVGWTSAGTDLEVTRSGLTLIGGTTYYFAVKARNRAGLWGAVGVSDGILADHTPPPPPVVTDDGVYTASTTTLHATWSAADPESGIAEYQYAIGLSAGGTNILGWTSTGSATQVTQSGLSLTDGTIYYVSVRARNRAGQWSDPGSSDGITADGSAPIAPVVIDDGEFTPLLDRLHASWNATDPHSGVTEYEYAIGTYAGASNLVSWKSAGLSTEVTETGLGLTQGATFYFSVKAKNGSGLWSISGASDGITADSTPPSAPVVTDDGQYTASAAAFHAIWSAADPESGVAEYQYAVGTTPGGTSIVDWTSTGVDAEVTKTGLSLADAVTYYISVRARNRAGRWSDPGTSDGIIVDASAPTTPVVLDDGQYTTSTNTLHATWSASDPHTGVAAYEYAIGTTSGGNEAVNWTPIGTATEITRTDLTLANGSTYYVAVKARNRADLWSIVGVSDGMVVDHAPPSPPVITDDGEFTSSTGSLHARWTAVDPESGVAEYQYAIGTTSGGTNIVGWTMAGSSIEVTRTGLPLVDTAAYYFSVRARDRVGHWSDPGMSDGITVDTSPPSTPAVTDDGDYTASFDVLHATWSANDPQSGIAEYQFAVGTTPGAADVAGWASAGPAIEGNATGLSLAENGVYYFTVRAKNKAGVWSTIGVSDGITVSSTPAWPQFRCDLKHQGVSKFVGSKFGALLWQYATSGWVESSPAIGGDGEVYVGSGDGALYAINRRGQLLWKYQTAGAIDSSPAIGKNGIIYFGSYDGYIYCLSANGTLLWRYLTGDMIWSSPVIGPDDAVYIGSEDGCLYAVKRNGQLKWRLDLKAAVWSSPALDENGILYFGANDGAIYAVYADAGTIKWRYQTGSAVDASPAIGPDGTVYAGSGDGFFYALNSDGTLKWQFYTGYATDSSAAIGTDGTIYIGTGHDWSFGLLYALNPDGTAKWEFDAHGEVRSSPAIGADGTIYIGSGDGNIYAVTPEGALKWKYQTGWAVLSSASIGKDGTVSIGSYSGNVFTFKDSNIVDPTAPTRPAVVDEGVATTSTSMLSAAWTASDPESGVEEYTYAIGTWPGTDDVVPWTQAGMQTTANRDDLELTVGTTYYFSVKARNKARLWSAVGVSDGIVVMDPSATVNIGTAKMLPDEALVYVSDKVITARFNGSFYIQESDRSAGMKVFPNGLQTPVEGSTVTLAGMMITDSGQRAMRLITMSPGSTTVPMPRPLGISNRTLCGGAPMEGRPAVEGGFGLNNIGLLVTTWGTVISTGDGWYFLDDGSGIPDPSGAVGIKVSLENLYPGQVIVIPSVGEILQVTGIVSMEWTGSNFRRVLRPSAQAGIFQLY